MKISSWKTDKLFVSSICIVSLIVFLYIFFASRYCCFWGDDYYYSQYSLDEGVFDVLNFKKEHGAGYIGFFFSKIFSFELPVLLDIHPMEFSGSVHSFIKSVFGIITILLITKFVTFFYNSKVLYFSSFILISTFIIYSILDTQSAVLIITYNFYRYFFSFIFFSIFWYYIYKSLLFKKNKTNYKKLILISTCAFILGTSLELASFSSAIMILFLLFYNFLLKILKKSHLTFNLDKYFYIPSLFLFIAILLFTTSDGFVSVAESRGIGRFIENIFLYKEFFLELLKIYVIDIYYIWVIFIFLIIFSISLIIKMGKSKNILKIIFPVFMWMAIFIVLCSLLLCGKTNDGSFFLMHQNIEFYIRILLIFPCLLLVGYFFGKMNKYNKNIVIIIFSMIIPFVLILNLIKREANFFQFEPMKEIKEIQYISEKIIRFYSLRNEIPYIPYEYTMESKYSVWFENDEEIECANNSILLAYFTKIYKNDFILQQGYCRSRNALEKYYENGGVFTEEELQNIKFSNLFNEDFVLNTKGKKLTVAEIKERIKE
ncbi:hypothetical protein IJD15_04030 [bacterium]|nr:hypothetical protein [bacterium]